MGKDLNQSGFEMFTDWYSNIKIWNDKKFRRRYFDKKAKKPTQLIVSCDASEIKLDVVADILISNVAFGMTKSRVAPIGEVAVPERELQVAFTACRTNNLILKYHQLKFFSVAFWMVSTIALHCPESFNKNQFCF